MSGADRAQPVGFHDGEIAVQRRAGVRSEASRLSGMLVPPDLRGAAGRFLAGRTVAALTARDGSGRLWISPLTGPPGVFDAVAASRLRIHTLPAPHDPLHGLSPGQPAALLAIEFAARRRFRVNGTLTAVGDTGLEFDVDQAYGNCPQYIQQRQFVRVPAAGHDTYGGPRPQAATTLTPAQADVIRGADTFFLGTTHPERGNDASHRGGPPGFVRVEGQSLWWPDYPGNNMFNSMGNLAVDSSAALLFADFGTGRTIHLSGTADLEWAEPGRTPDEGGTGRRVRFHIRSVLDGSRPALRAGEAVPSPHNPPLSGA